jgi:hypothetical protein
MRRLNQGSGGRTDPAGVLDTPPPTGPAFDWGPRKCVEAKKERLREGYSVTRAASPQPRRHNTALPPLIARRADRRHGPRKPLVHFSEMLLVGTRRPRAEHSIGGECGCVWNDRAAASRWPQHPSNRTWFALGGSGRPWANKRHGTALENPSLALGRRGVSGPDCRHLLLECRFEMLQRAGRGLARESGEVVHHVHLVVVVEAMGDLGP